MSTDIFIIYITYTQQNYFYFYKKTFKIIIFSNYSKQLKSLILESLKYYKSC